MSCGFVNYVTGFGLIGACIAGAEYERQLESCLDLARLAYDTEALLREKGAFKTPDALLQVFLLQLKLCIRLLLQAWQFIPFCFK